MSRPSCPCGFNRVDGAFTVAWHEEHRAHHLATFPAVDDITRANLQSFIDHARERDRFEARADTVVDVPGQLDIFGGEVGA